MRFLFVLFFLFCTQTQDERKLTIGLSSDLGSLDPLFATDLISRKMNQLYFKKLFKKSKGGEVVNDLVTSSTWGKGEVTFLLSKQHLSLNSEDVVYSLQRAKQELHPQSHLFQIIKKIESTENNEVKIHFQGSKEEVIDLLSSPPAAIYKASAHKEGDFISNPNLLLETWSRGNEIIFKINNYEKLDKLHFKILQNSSSAVYLFSKGQLQIFKLPYFLSNHPETIKHKLLSVEGNSVQYISFNQKNLCFDKYFRLALNLAIHRDRINEKVFSNLSKNTYLAFPEKYVFQKNKRKEFQYIYNPDLAREYLNKSLCSKKWKNESIELRMRADDENKAKGAVIAQDLKAIGLRVTLKPMEKAPLYKENGMGMGDLTLLTWYADYDSPLNFIDPLFASDKFGNAGNRAFYKNPKIDEIIFESRKRLILTEESQGKIMEILKEDMPWVFLWSLHENYLIDESSPIQKDIEQFLF